MTTKTKCRACQWWNATKEDGFCDSCRPLVERYAKLIINPPIIDFTGPTKLNESEVEYLKWNKKNQLWEKLKQYKKSKTIMKQLSTEFLRKEIILNSITKEDSNGRVSFKIGLSKLDKLSSEANELERQQSDDYAIEFADWLIKRQINYFESLTELLKVFKKEKGYESIV